MLAEIIHKLAEMEGDGQQPYRERPSLAGPERCIRQLVYYAAGYKRKPWPGRFILTVDDSSWHEELTRDWIRKSAYRIHSEQMEIEIYLHEDIRMQGHIDGIISDSTGREFHYEHKALNHFSFQRYWAGALPLDYITQCYLYVFGLQKVQPDITDSILLIKNKNTAQFMEFYLKHDTEKDKSIILERILSTGERIEMNEILKDIKKDVIEKFLEVRERVRKSILPTRPFSRPEDYPCAYCGWVGICWESYEEEIESREEDALLPDDMLQILARYREIARTETFLKKEKAELRTDILKRLEELSVKQGEVGAYRVKLSVSKRCHLNKELLPPDVLAAATEEKITQRLVVSGGIE